MPGAAAAASLALQPTLQPALPASSWLVMLTATISHPVDLTGRWFGAKQQLDEDDRRRTYEESVLRWATESSVPVMLVENSGASLDSLRARIPAARRPTFELVSVNRSTTCDEMEIGCHEAMAILDGVRASRLAVPFSHVLKVTGRYVLKDFSMEALLASCATDAPELMVQNPEWQKHQRGEPGWRQETQVFGFRKAAAEEIFGWARAGKKKQEKHIAEAAERLRAAGADVCDLPSMPLRDPVAEGSTGIVRHSLLAAQL